MNRLFFLFLVFFALSLIQSCATTHKTMKRQDPLIGKIINTKSNQAIDFESLIKDISTYDVIYLSEKHDNPEQHHIQQRVILGLIEKGLTPTLGFEFFSLEDTPDLLNFVDSGKVTHTKKIEKIIEIDLRKKLRWDTQSDIMWNYYYDLLSIAKEEKLKVAGIDLPSALKKRITRKGINGISSIEKEQVFTTQLSDETYKDYMFSIFKAVHCGMGNEKMQARLYDTWMARNDKMALSITRLYKHYKGPIVIIIGGGHTEYGLGVINRVAAIDKTIKQVNIALKEISVKPSGLLEYVLPLELAGFEKVPLADFLWFTQRVSYADPCEEFKKSLKKMKKKSKEL
ncbi:MAG: ChaN family lipoprotein [Deltaproteobacteria bacterium]|uniref:ChaN family lipoprotein n=1 Tax=Desulfobacula sp. TaxID=2593537 RepID=UPI0019B2D1B0|nr:ChaN family lipoprotein [Candidatus Desulfobacula maris]MBL6993547.1 ChaN family lipoprotein [Desulfobacula sp.]